MQDSLLPSSTPLGGDGAKAEIDSGKHIRNFKKFINIMLKQRVMEPDMYSLVNFLEENRDSNSPMSAHDRFLSYIETKLEQIILEKPQQVYKEIALPRIEGTSLGQVDLIAFGYDKMYLIEAKIISNNRNTARHNKYEINKQLDKAYDFFWNKFGVSCVMIGVYKKKGASKFENYIHPYGSRPTKSLRNCVTYSELDLSG